MYLECISFFDTFQKKALPPTFKVIAVWHPRTNNSPIHKWLIEQLQNL